jgi:hypothetical protein
MKEHPTSVDKVLVCNLRKQSDEKAITSLGTPIIIILFFLLQGEQSHI